MNLEAVFAQNYTGILREKIKAVIVDSITYTFKSIYTIGLHIHFL